PPTRSSRRGKPAARLDHRPRLLVAPRGIRGAPRSPTRLLVAPRETRGAPRSPATFYIYTRLPGLIAWLPVLQSGHDSGGHVVADTVARATRFTSNAA